MAGGVTALAVGAGFAFAAAVFSALGLTGGRRGVGHTDPS
jgi:hypothetical protein